MSQKISPPHLASEEIFGVPIGRTYYCLMAVFAVEVGSRLWPRFLATPLNIAGHALPQIMMHTVFTLWIGAAVAAAYLPAQVIFRFLFSFSYFAIYFGVGKLDSNPIDLDALAGLAMSIIMCAPTSHELYAKRVRWIEALLLSLLLAIHIVAVVAHSSAGAHNIYLVLAIFTICACMFRINRLSQDRLRMMVIFAVLITSSLIQGIVAFALSYCLVAIFFEREFLVKRTAK